MRTTFYSLVIILLALHSSVAQYKVSGYVLEKETRKPISYVNIGSPTTNSGTVSDDNGYFEMTCDSENEKIIFSSIGYTTQEIIASNLSEDEILLESIDYKIQEVKIVSSNFDKEVILGERNEKGRGMSISFGNPQLGTELGALIEVKKETYIKTANFVLNHAKGDSLLLRINIRRYENGQVGEKIVKKNIYVKDKQRKGTYSVDLSSYDIILTSDVLLSVEWLRNFGEMGNEHVTFDTKKARKPKQLRGIYLKNSSVSGFRKLPAKKKLKPCMYFVGKQSSE